MPQVQRLRESPVTKTNNRGRVRVRAKVRIRIRVRVRALRLTESIVVCNKPSEANPTTNSRFDRSIATVPS